jgi:hypothetical protein
VGATFALQAFGISQLDGLTAVISASGLMFAARLPKGSRQFCASIVVIEPPVDVAAKRTLRRENTRSHWSHKLSSRHFGDEGSAMQCSGAMLQSEKV